MDEQTLRVLEFDKILGMAGAFTQTTPGRVNVQKMRPQTETAGIQTKINLISEWKRLLEEGRQAGIDHFDDLSPLFRKLRPADAVLEPLELRSFLPLFDSALRLRQLNIAGSCPALAEVISGIITHPHLRKRINTALDIDGTIRDEASSQLLFVRRSIKSHEEKIRRSLESLLQRKDLIPHLQDFYITERGNRWVIPVKRDSRGRVPGIVHDISNTGETVFVEPSVIHESGNELEALRAEEKLEIYRVLQGLSAQVKEHIHDIEEDYRLIADLDALLSLARFSIEMHMSPPVISEDGTLRIIRGRHPLLWKTLRNEGRESELVPLNMELGNSTTCLVITGSNAGGKTVALKTAGVLSLMALCGFHVPSDSGSVFPFLDQVFSDIGDEQSIEQKLSTFSAHISRLSRIISRSDDRTIVIIDELGTGTDPEQGGALACAILRQLRKQGALAIVSTHLGILKAFAHTEPGVMNCAMEMEEALVNGTVTFRPTYRLVMGEPGMSHAFEIASVIGLQQEVIDEAKGLLQGGAAGLEEMISDLRAERRHLEESRKETEQLKDEVSRLRQRLDEEMTLLSTKKQDILARALGEAEGIMRKTKAEAMDIIRALRRSSRDEAGKVVKRVDGAMKELKKQKQRISPPKIIPLTKVTAGQPVYVQGLETGAVVKSVHMRSGRCRVLVRGREIEVPLSALSMLQEEPTDQASAGTVHRSEAISRIDRIDRDVPDSLNIVGQRVDPALALVERYLNDASISNKREVRIIHGVGTGILMKAVREYLEEHPLVEGTRRGNPDEGGEGVTVVQL